MESVPLFVFILSMITLADVVHSQHIHASENPVAVGSNVTLFSTVSIQFGTWRFNEGPIVFKYPGGYILDRYWRNRITYNSTAEALTIWSIKLNESGVYELEEVNSFRDELKLSVQEPVSNVTLWVNKTNLVEYNDTVVIMCSVSEGTNLSYKWLKSNSTTADGTEVQLKNENATLTIVGVTRSDQGLYRCNVSNGVGYEISPFVRLNVSYGPSNTMVMVTPVKYIHRAGSNITLSCSTESNPSAMVQWMMNNKYLNQYGYQLQLQNIELNNSGIYKCVTYNSVTLRSDSANTTIQVMDPLTTVVMSHTSGPAILNKSFTLQCEVQDTVNRILWFKDGQLISADNTTVFGVDNKTLTLSSVQQSDGGHYQCQAFNLVSNMTSSHFTVVVNYGPEMPTIMGPNVVKTGDNVTLKCHANSTPPSHYKWYINASEVSNMSEYTTPSLTKEWSGIYICMALNNITNETSTAYIMITVVDPIENVQIKAQMDPAIEGHPYYMTCNVTGPADQIYWMKDWAILHADNRTVFYMGNNTVKYMSVSRSDAGYFQCVARNAVGNMTSAHYMLVVNYGPEIATIVGPTVVKTGDNVILRCHANSTPQSYYNWYFNDTVVSNMSEYTTASLTKERSGKYICMAFNNITNKNNTAYIMITVIDPVENVQLKPQMDPAIKGHPFYMKCDFTGTADYISWMKNGERLNPDNRINFDMYNKKIMFMSMEHSDEGHYHCMAGNAFGNESSALYNLVVNFGPETAMIDGPAFAETGSYISFSCSAMSKPPSYFSWSFKPNNTGLNDTQCIYMENMVSNSSMFTAGPLSLNMSGEYICMVYNPVTRKNITNSTVLTVIEAIDSVMILSNTTPINNQNLTLTCHVVGPYEMIYWMKGSMLLNMSGCDPDSNMWYYIEKNMLHFSPLTLHSNGTYECVAANKAVHHKSPKYNLLVNYGPLRVNISGPDSGKQGNSVSLTCTAESRPECDFQWFFNNGSVVKNNGSVITFFATKDDEGTYKCEATNPVTNKTMSTTKYFTVSGRASSVHFNTQEGLIFMGLLAFSAHVLFH